MKHLIAFFALVLLAGCASTDAVMLTGHKYPPIDPDRVAVFVSSSDAPAKYTKIASLQTKGDHGLSRSALIKSMKKEAAKLGANGVILGEEREASTGSQIAAALLLTQANDEIDAIAIRY